jgi:hypothetical protein
VLDGGRPCPRYVLMTRARGALFLRLPNRTQRQPFSRHSVLFSRAGEREEEPIPRRAQAPGPRPRRAGGGDAGMNAPPGRDLCTCGHRRREHVQEAGPTFAFPASCPSPRSLDVLSVFSTRPSPLRVPVLSQRTPHVYGSPGVWVTFRASSRASARDRLNHPKIYVTKAMSSQAARSQRITLM